MNLRGNKAAVLVRMLCMLALVFLSFAHKPVVAAPLSPAELAAITLPDGTVADLCINGGVEHGKPKQGLGPACEACRISAAALLPVPTDIGGRLIAFRIVADRPLIEAVVTGQRYELGAPPTAPPHLSI
ncbi:hypothetical protein J2Y48_001341 [Mycoplana sp. BE70]|uniref:hypothetical protein n=1 Tax=Mycoplana sp. BE70 TaxID=2817775 RepID=UPI00285F98AF|nr:hypothetical protein [Mycoplana sp. BE70]MDR6756051.1 hypothetical protein [Mycoplana sp. BE70]